MKATMHSTRPAYSRLVAAAVLCLLWAASVAAQVSAPGASPPHSSGPEGAPVTVEIFNDYECPACAPVYEEVKYFEQVYRGGVRVVFRNYPLPMHGHSLAAAKAAEAAGAQGKFRAMLDTLYARQKEWSTSARPERRFSAYARGLGLDVRRFESDSESGRVAERIRLDKERGNALSLRGTPTLYVNGVEVAPGKLATRATILAAIDGALPKGWAAPSDAPRFEDYPAREIYKGPVAPVRLDGRRARMYRTRLREDARAGPNFAGRYTVVVWGCGTGCAQMGVVDSKTGRVYFPPFEYMDIPDVEDEATRGFKLDSRLLVVTRNHYDGVGGYAAYYYLFDGNRFRLLRKAEERAPQTTEDEN